MHKLTRCFTIIILTSCYWSSANAQYYFYNDDYYESPLTFNVGIGFGAMNCLTDLGGKQGSNRKFIKDINWNVTHPGGSLFVGANYKDLLEARLELAFGQVEANDNVLKNDQSISYGRYLRNLNFRSDIKELSFSIELFPFAILHNNDLEQSFINPYFFVGLGYFHFNPSAFYNNSWIDLRDLHTEGQGFEQYPDRKPYKLNQFNMPMGLGLRYEVSPVLNFNLEVTYRKLWTDYLDDVSKTYVDPTLFQKYFTPSKANLAKALADRRLASNPGLIETYGTIRGNPANNDTYFSALIKIAFIIGRQRR